MPAHSSSAGALGGLWQVPAGRRDPHRQHYDALSEIQSCSLNQSVPSEYRRPMCKKGATSEHEYQETQMQPFVRKVIEIEV
jgi:hypothetical protein